MRIHYLQHVDYESLGIIEDWIEQNKFSLTQTKLFEDEDFPNTDEYDFLIIMGGPMNINEIDKYPWLANEKKFIKMAIHSGKQVLGICLGAQLIADALGAKVVQNNHIEIGWFPVKSADKFKKLYDDQLLPNLFTPLHWHDDTFTLPEESILIGTSSACNNQGFIYQNNILALQFHLEMKKDDIIKIIDNSDLPEAGVFIQKTPQLLNENNIRSSHKLMYKILDDIKKRFIGETN